MVAHELFGHGFDSDQGQLNREINPATGLRFSEESAMAAENNFNKSAGRDPQRNRGDKPLPEWSVSGDLITGNRAQGTRIGCDQKETNVC